MIEKKILLIPDSYFGSQSGAIVAQMAMKIFKNRGYKVSVFSTDIKKNYEVNEGDKFYSRTAYNGRSNYFSKKYKIEFIKVLEDFQPNVIFFIGSLTNKNICYFEISIKRKIKIISKIFMQDFFCVKFYACDRFKTCTKCLENSYINAIIDKCIIKYPIDYIKTLSAIFIRKKFQKILPKTDYILYSSEKQLQYFNLYGINKDKCIKTSLYYDINRLKFANIHYEEYFICIAQNRIEKGFHLLSNILEYCNQNIKIIIAYNNKEQAELAIIENRFEKYINNGMLKVIYEITWNSGLSQLIANSKGVIIPSIWPTTTEFGLLEALGLKKAVFCFSVGIHSEVIINGYNGFTAELQDFKNMAEQINNYHLNFEKYQNISNNAYDLFLQLTSWEKWNSDIDKMNL